jgi:hypothetical protein
MMGIHSGSYRQWLFESRMFLEQSKEAQRPSSLTLSVGLGDPAYLAFARCSLPTCLDRMSEIAMHRDGRCAPRELKALCSFLVLVLPHSAFLRRSRYPQVDKLIDRRPLRIPHIGIIVKSRVRRHECRRDDLSRRAAGNVVASSGKGKPGASAPETPVGMTQR